MILEVILLLLTGGVMVYAAHYDIKNHEIQLSTIISIAILGFLFFILSGASLFDLIYAEIIITIIYLIPAMLGMGFGDMLLFWGLGFFLIDQLYINSFLLGFFVSAIILTIYQVDKYGLWKNKNRLQSIEFPLVPAILSGFVLFLIIYLINSLI